MAKSNGTKKLEAMDAYLQMGEISAYRGNKAGFKTASMAFLRQLLKDVGAEVNVVESKVRYNEAGPAVAGDPSLYFMTDKGSGCMVQICEKMAGLPSILYRGIRSMKDYTGERNQWIESTAGYDVIVRNVALTASVPTMANYSSSHSCNLLIS